MAAAGTSLGGREFYPGCELRSSGGWSSRRWRSGAQRSGGQRSGVELRRTELGAELSWGGRWPACRCSECCPAEPSVVQPPAAPPAGRAAPLPTPTCPPLQAQGPPGWWMLLKLALTGLCPPPGVCSGRLTSPPAVILLISSQVRDSAPWAGGCEHPGHVPCLLRVAVP